MFKVNPGDLVKFTEGSAMYAALPPSADHDGWPVGHIIAEDENGLVVNSNQETGLLEVMLAR